ncbi:MAG: hypothetical protein ACOYN4_12760 [Bacteroidales bacterium]
MKTKIQTLKAALGIVVLVSVGLAFSAFRTPTENQRAQLVSTIRNYLDKNVKPTMAPQRAKLDLTLSTEEKAEVAKLNARLRKLISKRHAAGVGFIAAEGFSFTEIPTLSTTQKASQKADRDEMRRIMSQSWAIADNHEKEISVLLNEKSKNMDVWENDIANIAKAYLDSKFFFIGGKQIVRRVENKEIIKYNLPVAFLLWDPQQRFVTDEMIKK